MVSTIETKPQAERPGKIDPIHAQGRQVVLAEVTRAGKKGTTWERINAETGMSVSDVVARLSELKRMGLIESNGTTSPWRGCKLVLWRCPSSAKPGRDA